MKLADIPSGLRNRLSTIVAGDYEIVEQPSEWTGKLVFWVVFQRGIGISKGQQVSGTLEQCLTSATGQPDLPDESVLTSLTFGVYEIYARDPVFGGGWVLTDGAAPLLWFASLRDAVRHVAENLT